MIKFETEKEEPKSPTFGDVEVNQFFIDIDGDFCQKSRDNKANRIAKYNGFPSAVSEMNMEPWEEIKKILPKVTNITWE